MDVWYVCVCVSVCVWFQARGSQAAHMLTSVWSVTSPRPARFRMHLKRKGGRDTGNCCRCDGCSGYVKAHPRHRHLVNHIGHQLPATKEQVDGTLTVTQDTDAKDKLILALHTNTPLPCKAIPKTKCFAQSLFVLHLPAGAGQRKEHACACQAAPAGAGQRKQHACPCQAASAGAGQQKEQTCASHR